MITKAIIEGMGVGTNRFYVRIPYFESAGEVEHAVYEATYCYTPGTVDTLNVGDVVFVGFEDHFSAKPVILGKLFTFGDYEGNSGATSVSSIDVSTKATLPRNTSIGGITVDGIDALFRRVDILEGSEGAPIADGAVTTPKIANGAVTTDKITYGAVTTSKIGSGAVQHNNLGSRVVDNDNLADRSVSQDKLVNGSVGTDQLRNEAVTTDKIADGAITNDKIAVGAIYNNNIVDGEIDSEKLAYASVGTDQLQDGSVTIDKLTDGSVGTDQLRNEAVTTGKIAYGAITGDKIAYGAITNDNIGDDEITSQKLAYASVGTNQLMGGSVTTDKIAYGAITGDKIATSTISRNRLKLAHKTLHEMFEDSGGNYITFIHGVEALIYAPYAKFTYLYKPDEHTVYYITPLYAYACTQNSSNPDMGIKFVFTLPDGTNKTIQWLLRTYSTEPAELADIVCEYLSN